METGNELSKLWYKANKPIMGPPASFGRQIYFVAETKLIVLDANSELWQQHNLPGKCLNAVTLSANHRYANASDGLYTFSFNLSTITKNNDVAGGISSPAIADDGTIYVMDLNKNLWPFGGRV